jgi:hypothetical protein
MKLNTSPSGAPSLLRRIASSKLAFSLATIRARTPAALAGESRKMRLGSDLEATRLTDFCAGFVRPGRTRWLRVEFLFMWPSGLQLLLFDASPIAASLQNRGNRSAMDGRLCPKHRVQAWRAVPLRKLQQRKERCLTCARCREH